MSRRLVVLIVLMVALTASIALLLRGSGGQRVVRYVSPRGSDNWPGTARRPWRTLRHAMRDVRPGETLILQPGVYGAVGQALVWARSGTSSAPIVVQGALGLPAPIVLGSTTVAASHLRILHLRFHGPTGSVAPRSGSNPLGEDVLVWLRGGDIELRSCEVSGDRWHAGVYVSGAGNVRLIGDYIHDNGNFARPQEANLDHGIYWGAGRPGVIADNLIVHNLAMGVQLYPAASDVVVAQNTIVGNGKSGVIVAGQAADNMIVDNIIADNGQYGIRSYELSGIGNRVEDNLLWNNATGNVDDAAGALATSGSIVAPPGFRGRDDYALASSSPAVDRATRLPQLPSVDFAGRSRPPRGDLGALQSP